MTTKQLGILNALVTFAAENIPGGLAEDEQEVARIVGTAALIGRDPMSSELTNERTHEYKTVNASDGPTEAVVANKWAEHGWRVVGVISDTRSGYAHQLMLERPVGVSHPDD